MTELQKIIDDIRRVAALDINLDFAYQVNLRMCINGWARKLEALPQYEDKQGAAEMSNEDDEFLKMTEECRTAIIAGDKPLHVFNNEDVIALCKKVQDKQKEKDAARYNWIRKNIGRLTIDTSFIGDFKQVDRVFLSKGLYNVIPESFDAAIDEAIRKGE
jgi:hypothetical protein